MLIQGDRLYISGNSGVYDNVVKNKSVRYGRNSVDNFYNRYLSQNVSREKPEFPLYMSDVFNLSDDEYNETMCLLENLSELPHEQEPLPNYEKRYMPKGKTPDIQALLGASYEEMGLRTSVPYQQMSYELSERYGMDLSADALDINQDKRIDISEYASHILMADILSSKKSSKEVTGTITSEGEEKAAKMLKKRHYEIANKAYRGLFETYGLNSEKNKFLLEKNNLSYPVTNLN